MPVVFDGFAFGSTGFGAGFGAAGEGFFRGVSSSKKSAFGLGLDCGVPNPMGLLGCSLLAGAVAPQKSSPAKALLRSSEISL